MTTTGPSNDEQVPAYLDQLGIPGLADVHVHFMPDRVMDKVWAHFDAADEYYGRDWPVLYRQPESQRLDILRALGLRAIPALNYAHRPGMAAWLNQWGSEFAGRVPDAVHSATLFPEPGVVEYVRTALESGARLWKVHVDVGDFSPVDPELDGAWGLIEDAGTPVVIHAGSGPHAGRFTGPEPVRALLSRHPRLALVIAHMGMPEYAEFAELAEEFEHVHLDTTMVATDFTQAFLPMPEGFARRLADLGDKVVLGADFPNIPHPYAHQLEGLARLDLGDEWMRSVLWHNGSRLLQLHDQPSRD